MTGRHVALSITLILLLSLLLTSRPFLLPLQPTTDHHCDRSDKDGGSTRAITMSLLVRLTCVLAALGQVLPSAATSTPASFRDKCLAFRPERHISNSTRTRLEYIPAGTTLELDDNVPSCNRPRQSVSVNLCRVALQIPTSRRSSISFELWLPEDWKHARYLATGNGGVDGCIKYEDLSYGTSNGFATMGTNNGHNGTTGVDFLNNPDIIEDFAYRALHTGTVSAKKLLKKFYAKKAKKSYFIGCSLGGRMGVQAAEKYPKDYDGIVAGAPAVDFNHLQGHRAMFYTITGGPDSPNYIPISTWTGLIHDEVLRQCDGLDWVLDGIIENPGRCFFDPTTLLCEEGQDGDCLNDAQVEQVQQIYAPYTYENGSLIFPRNNPGNEIGAVQKLLAGAPFAYSVDWFRYVVLNDTTWQAEDYNRDLVRQADDLNPFNIRTYPRALPEFKKSGGKMIAYHGGQDNQIPSFNTERWYDHMSAADPRLKDYFRTFRISGMNHCNGGPGAWVLGQGGGDPSRGVPFDKPYNTLAAVVEWVERGKAPNTLTGTKFVDDNADNGIDFQRDHCMYPKNQTYVGGNYKLRSSWRCM